MKTVVAIGELLIDFVPQRLCALDEVVQFERVAGGAPANVATAVARLGGRAQMISQVGGRIRYAHSQNAARKRREHLNGVPHRTGGEYRAGVCFTLIRTATASFPSTAILGRPVSR